MPKTKSVRPMPANVKDRVCWFCGQTAVNERHFVFYYMHGELEDGTIAVFTRIHNCVRKYARDTGLEEPRYADSKGNGKNS